MTTPPGSSSSHLPGTSRAAAASYPDVDRGVSATIPDASREASRTFWHPGPKLLAAIRDYQRYKQSRNPFKLVLKRIALYRYRFWSVVTGSEIALHCKIAPGLALTHPSGVVINDNAVIGPNCLILQQVTLGTRGPDSAAPRLEGHVDVGAGAKILGGVTIGAHAQIGANAVVLCDVPPMSIAVGIPARIIPRNPAEVAQ